MQDDEAKTRRALDLLGSRRNDRYEAALAELREDTRDWADVQAHDPNELGENEKPATADVEGLRHFPEAGRKKLDSSGNRAGVSGFGVIQSPV